MTKEEDSMQTKLKELRVQLEDSRSGEAMESEEAETPQVDTASDTETNTKNEEKDGGEAGADDVSAHLQDLVDRMNKELRGTHPITVLSAFVLGILFGRFLSR